VISPGAKLQRKTLSEQVEELIREHIVSGKIAPGQALPSSVQLAAQFGVSRAIVREALKSLEARGLITIANGKRATVNPANNQILVDYFDRMAQDRDEALIELLELRRGLEVQGAFLAAERRTDDEMRLIRDLVRQMRAQVGALDAYLDLDVQLHLAIAGASHNRMLHHLVDSLRGPARDTMEKGQVLHSSDQEREMIQVNHEILVDLIDRRDAAGAAACMTKHFDEAIAGIVNAKDKHAR
jgi:DNA-binding FadR family transcriptional regulator